MSYYIIIRGPAGVGKSAVAGKLCRKLNAYRISYDRVMRKHKLDKVEGSCISEKNFRKANDLAIAAAKKKLDAGKIVVFDGCFYHKSQLRHLIKKLHCRYFVFSLKVSLEECIERDSKRKAKIGKNSVKAVYSLCSKFSSGTVIDTKNKTPEETMKEIISHLPIQQRLRVPFCLFHVL